MKKASPLVVPGVEDYLTRYKEEIAHEFGIPFSQGEIASKSAMHHVTDRLINKKRDQKRDQNHDC